MSRDPKHVTETRSRVIFEDAASAYSSEELHILKGGLLFRVLSERDYGVDAELEILENGKVTSKQARIQLKGTEKAIERLKTSNHVSCPGVSRSSLGYCEYDNIPYILVYVSEADRRFYYCDLQPLYDEIMEKIGKSDSVTVRIPYDNNSDDLSILVRIINQYFIKKNNRFTGKRRAYTVTHDENKKVREERASDYSDNVSEQTNETIDEYKEINGMSFDGEIGNLWDYPSDVTSYEVEEYDTPSDGKHKMVDCEGNTVKVGIWKDGELDKGTEYNTLIRVTKGGLIFKPGYPEDPYDATDEFEYEKLEMYHWETLSPFSWSEHSIAEVGIDKCYVVDIEVDGDMEQIVNVRTLVEFLASKNPRHLKMFRESIQLDREEILEYSGEYIESMGFSKELQPDEQLMEAVLREREARLMDQNGNITDVTYSVMDLLQLFMESNYSKMDSHSIGLAVSKRALDHKSDKNTYWKYAAVNNAVPGMIDRSAIQELVNVARAYDLIGCDMNGIFYVTEKGKETVNKGIIVLDETKEGKG